MMEMVSLTGEKPTRTPKADPVWLGTPLLSFRKPTMPTDPTLLT